ncbi:TPA: molecular chaperone, partial [Raoultella planticola]|nr:molecular chaperone [Raoultella planticola]
MKHIIAAAAAAFLLLSTTVQAGIVMGGTRVIYQEGKREASISVTNADVHSPYLVQSWIENYAENDKSKVPFIVTPPLFRLDPEQENVLRINFIGADLPHDRESVFWLNVKSI